MSVAIQTKSSKKVIMKKLIFIIVIISFSSLNIYGASKSEIENIEKFECDFFEIEKSIEIINPFSKTDQPRRLCHMRN